MDKSMRTPAELVEKFIDAGISKASMQISKMFILSIMAGAFIAFGASSSSLAMHAIENPGLAKFVAGAIFPVGLMLIVFIGGELFTGDCLMIMGCQKKKYSVQKMIGRLALVLFGNLVGACVVATLVYYSGQYDMSAGALGAFTIKVAYGKATISFGKAVASGILCNILVCCAVMMAMAAKDVTGKIFAIFFPIMAFVCGGFEHCVANMYYIPAGLLAVHNETYRTKAMELYGYTEAQLSALNVQNFFVTNLLPVVIGNVIGGMVFVGLPLFYIHQMKKENSVQSGVSQTGNGKRVA